MSDSVCVVCGESIGGGPYYYAPSLGGSERVHDACHSRYDNAPSARATTQAAAPGPQTKDPWRLLPMEAMHDVLGALLLGAQKYGADDWRTRPAIFAESWEAGMRHLQGIGVGEELDPESGLHHAAHLVCRGLFMIADYKKRNPPK